MSRSWALLVALLVSCSSGKAYPPPPDTYPSFTDARADFGPRPPDGPPRDFPRDDGEADGDAPDFGPDGPLPDAPEPDAGCQLGTPDDCASCGDRCPGPTSGTTTERSCVAAKCDIRCMAEFYDVNGDADDGCEAADDTPTHETEAKAATIGAGSVGDCDPIQTTAAVIPSDDRKHAQAPSDRPQGRPDYFTIEIKDSTCVINATVKVLLTSLPAGASYELSSFYTCSNGTQLDPDSATVNGGTTTILNPSTSCSLWGLGNDSGTLLIAVRKLSGPHTADTYEIEVEP